jgi:hypothetical protein
LKGARIDEHLPWEEIETSLRLEWALAYRSAKAARALTQAHRRASVAPEKARAADGNACNRGERWPCVRVVARSGAASDALVRILRATVRLVDEHGFTSLSAGDIVREARVSHHTFRKHVGTSEEAFLAAYRAGNRETIKYALKAYSAAPDWPTAVHAGLAAQLQFFAERPELARIGFVEV